MLQWAFLLAIIDKGDCVMRCIFSLPVAMGVLLVTLGGCEEFHHAMRRGDDGKTNLESETPKMLAVDADPKKPKPFFANNRLAGGWSSEAREIESHLGVSP